MTPAPRIDVTITARTTTVDMSGLRLVTHRDGLAQLYGVSTLGSDLTDLVTDIRRLLDAAVAAHEGTYQS